MCYNLLNETERMGLVLAEYVHNISNFYRTFSGTDTIAFLLLPNCSPITLGSVTTVSYSIFRNKKPVINIGRTSINGVTRGSRIYAGTMIFTLINQYWIRDIQEQCSYLKDYKDLKADELPIFDIMLVSANEYGSSVSMYIYGIDFTDEAQTLSVEDLFTENTFSFIARDVSSFQALKQNEPVRNYGGAIRGGVTFGQKLYVIDSTELTLKDLQKLAKDQWEKFKANLKTKSKKYKMIARDLYLSATRLMVGNDIAELQALLNAVQHLHVLDVNGVFDEAMKNVVKEYQSRHGLEITGVIDNKVYNHILNEVKSNPDHIMAMVINKGGAHSYEKPMLTSNITYTYPFKEHILVSDIVPSYDGSGKFYKSSTGYISENDVYTHLHNIGTVEYPTLTYGADNEYVSMAKDMLSTIYKLYVDTSTSLFDYEMSEFLKKFQRDYGLKPTGICDAATWDMLVAVSKAKPSVTEKKVKMEYTGNPPGKYTFEMGKILEKLPLYQGKVTADGYITVKETVIATYSDGYKRTFHQVKRAEKSCLYGVEHLKKSLMYDPKHGFPVKVSYVVYVYNNQSMRWDFEIKKEG